MMVKSRGIVLHYVAYGETSIVAHIYTEQQGRQAFIASGVRTKRGRPRLVCFQPLSLLELTYPAKATATLIRLKDAQLLTPFYRIHHDLHRQSVAVFIAELLYKTLQEAESNPGLFNFLFQAVELLELTDKRMANFHLAFMLQLSRHLGILPELSGHTGFSGSNQDHQTPAGPATFDELKQWLISRPFGAFNTLAISYLQRQKFTDDFIRYYQRHFDSLTGLKSLQVLREIFGE